MKKRIIFLLTIVFLFSSIPAIAQDEASLENIIPIEEKELSETVQSDEEKILDSEDDLEDDLVEDFQEIGDEIVDDDEVAKDNINPLVEQVGEQIGNDEEAEDEVEYEEKDTEEDIITDENLPENSVSNDSGEEILGDTEEENNIDEIIDDSSEEIIPSDDPEEEISVGETDGTIENEREIEKSVEKEDEVDVDSVGETESEENVEEPKLLFMPVVKQRGETLFQWLSQIISKVNDTEETIITLRKGEYEFTNSIELEDKNIKLENIETELVKFKRADGFENPFFIVKESATLTLHSFTSFNDDESVSAGIVFDGEGKEGKDVKATNTENEGRFIQNGGKLFIDGVVFENDKSTEGGEYIAPIVADGEEAEIIFKDGYIRNNEYVNSKFSAGGILLNNGAKMDFIKGKIYKNFAGYLQKKYIPMVDEDNSGFINYWPNEHLKFSNGTAGGIIVNNESKLVIEDEAIISENQGETGGILVGNANYKDFNRSTGGNGVLQGKSNSEVIMNGGSIDKNIGRGSGGGVTVYGKGDFKMLGGKIDNNDGMRSGGVFVYDLYANGNWGSRGQLSWDYDNWKKEYPAIFTLDGGEITNNFAYMNGGGLTVASDNVYLIKGLFQGNETEDSDYGSGEGGAILVTQPPYTLKVKNLLIKDNTATLDGGGLWFCNTGGFELYSNEGLALYDNINNDFASFNKYNFNFEIFGYTLPARMLGGGKVDYYEVEKVNRSGVVNSWNIHPDKPDEMEILKTLLDDLFKPGQSSKDYDLRMTVHADNLAKLNAESLSTVKIIGNIGQYGGGIATNGHLIIGEPNKVEIEVEKEFIGMEGKEVELEVGYVYEGTEHVIENVVLNNENGYKVVIKDLPTKILNLDLKNVLYLKEINRDEDVEFTVEETDLVIEEKEDKFHVKYQSEEEKFNKYNVYRYILKATNKPREFGDIIISKEVINKADDNGRFEFLFELKDEEGKEVSNKEFYYIRGAVEAIKDPNFEFFNTDGTLKDGFVEGYITSGSEFVLNNLEGIRILKVPTVTIYKDIDADNYEKETKLKNIYYITEKYNPDYAAINEVFSGEIINGIKDLSGRYVSENKFENLKLGKIVISKEVVGEETDKQFSFNIIFKDEDFVELDDLFDYILSNIDEILEDGKIKSGDTFYLRNGETIEISRVPYGTYYEVNEMYDEDYYVLATGNIGVVDSDLNIVKFKNIEIPDEPDTPDKPDKPDTPGKPEKPKNEEFEKILEPEEVVEEIEAPAPIDAALAPVEPIEPALAPGEVINPKEAPKTFDEGIAIYLLIALSSVLGFAVLRKEYN